MLFAMYFYSGDSQVLTQGFHLVPFGNFLMQKIFQQDLPYFFLLLFSQVLFSVVFHFQIRPRLIVTHTDKLHCLTSDFFFSFKKKMNAFISLFLMLPIFHTSDNETSLCLRLNCISHLSSRAKLEIKYCCSISSSQKQVLSLKC